jgi:signal transduction histidine kinase
MKAPAFRWGDHAVAGLPASDVALSAVLMVAAVATTLEIKQPEGPLAVTLPVAIAMTAALAWRARSPLVSLVVVVLASMVQAAVATAPGTLWSLAAFLLAAYSVARFCPEGMASAGGALLIAALVLQEIQDGTGGDYLFALIVFGGAWLLGRAVRQWQERATVAESNQDLLARSAVAEERVRIARELHDVVAHSISVISVQANAAEAALDRSPDLARAPLRAIKSSSREALEEMRRLLVLLRSDDEQEQPRPQPGLGELTVLMESVRGAGLPVDVHVRGTAVPLPLGVDMSAYRILQEALTNVLKHAGPVPTRVEVGFEPRAVTLAVVNGPGAAARPADGLGHGLVGIRERVTLLGGVLHAGVEESGGYAVRAQLPIEEIR